MNTRHPTYPTREEIARDPIEANRAAAERRCNRWHCWRFRILGVPCTAFRSAQGSLLIVAHVLGREVVLVRAEEEI